MKKNQSAIHKLVVPVDFYKRKQYEPNRNRGELSALGKSLVYAPNIAPVMMLMEVNMV